MPTALSPATTGCEALFSLLDLFKKFGEGYYLLTHFKCRKALQIFESIPTSQRETGWVLSQMGRAHFEQANYAEAARTFAKARAIAPLRVECMDIYSTSLWHLKHDVDLAFLSYELVDLDRLSPQTWCALGNSFSLQRDHSNAIKCFRRATQIDPMFAYAFTLEGHEHISNEEYDNAIHAFRKGIAVKKRHYNAWYGLGIVHQKLGKFDLAPQKASVYVLLGRMYGLAGEKGKAVENYTVALSLNPQVHVSLALSCLNIC
ncbi:TPR-like protein [Cadophora sp. DSE1049]|nr:TPR-like protein [Cadophora sp. DSE1049]